METNKKYLLVKNDVTISITWILPSAVQITKTLFTYCGGLHSKYSKSPQLDHTVAGWGVENGTGYTLVLVRSSCGELRVSHGAVTQYPRPLQGSLAFKLGI